MSEEWGMSKRLAVLILEDDPALARATRRQLESHYQVRVALSSEQARAQLNEWVPDVLLCDYHLASEDATAFLEEVAVSHPKMRRVLYSGSQPVDWELLLRRGLVHAVVAKPALVEELTAALEPRDG